MEDRIKWFLTGAFAVCAVFLAAVVAGTILLLVIESEEDSHERPPQAPARSSAVYSSLGGSVPQGSSKEESPTTRRGFRVVAPRRGTGKGDRGSLSREHNARCCKLA
jgi:hypothetical protein